MASVSGKRLPWTKKKSKIARLAAANQAKMSQRSSNLNGTIDLSDDISTIPAAIETHEDNSASLAKKLYQEGMPILESYDAMDVSDPPIRKRSNCSHSTPLTTANLVSKISDLENQLENCRHELAVKTVRLVDAENTISRQQHEINILKKCSVPDQKWHIEFLEEGKLAMIQSDSKPRSFFYATIDPMKPYSALSHARDKSRRFDILTNFLKHLCKDGGNKREMGLFLGDFLRRNSEINDYISPKTSKYSSLQLSPSDSLDFKLSLGLSWDDYRKIKAFMSKLNSDFLASTADAIEETSSRKIKSDLNFSLILIKEKNESVMKPLLVVSNLIDFIEECWAETVKHGNLTEDNPRFQGQIWISIGGDNGGGTTKLTLSFINVLKPNSVHNTHLIGYFDGPDKAENLRSAFSQLSHQVDKIQNSLKLPYPLPNGGSESRAVRLFLVGDTVFLSYFCGHQGPASSFPCLYCLIKLSDLKLKGKDEKAAIFSKTYRHRDIQGKQLSNSQTQYPLFNIPLENIVPPVLHIPLGLFNDVFKQIRAMCKKMDLVKEFPLDQELSNDMWKKETSVEDLIKAIMNRIDFLSVEVNCLEEDLSIYTRLEKMTQTCIETDVQPIRASRHCSSNYCISSFPLFKKYCDKWLYCKDCPNMVHMACGLILTEHQMSTFQIDSFQCFNCRGINHTAAILQVCREMKQRIENQISNLRKSVNENKEKAIQLDNKLEMLKGSCEKSLFNALDTLGVDLKAYHSGTFVGNHVFHMLKNANGLNGPKLLTECLKGRPEDQERFYHLLIILGKIFALTTKVGFLEEDEIINLDDLCEDLRRIMIEKFPDWATTVKLHLLINHVIEFVKRHKACGSFSEQGIESLHAQMNHIRRLFVMRGARKYMPLIFQHHHLLASVREPERFTPRKRNLKLYSSEGCPSTEDSQNVDVTAHEYPSSDDDFEEEF